MKTNFLIILLFSLICNGINATIGKIEVLDAGDNKAKVILFSDLHFLGNEQRPYANDVDFKQACWTALGLNKYFKSTNHISLFEAGPVNYQTNNLPEKIAKDIKQFCSNYMNELCFSKKRGYLFLFNSYIICSSYFLPIKNIECRISLEENEVFNYYKCILSDEFFCKYPLKELKDDLLNKLSLLEREAKSIKNFFYIEAITINIFDLVLLKNIMQNTTNKYIFVFVGAGHAQNISKILKSKFKYKQIKLINNFEEAALDIILEMQNMRLNQLENKAKFENQDQVQQISKILKVLNNPLIFAPVDIKKFFDEFAIEENLVAQQSANSNPIKIKSKL